MHRVSVGFQEFLLVEPRFEIHDLGLMLPRRLLSKVFHELVEHRGVFVARWDGRRDE